MNNMLAFNLSVPKDVALQIAARVKARRLELDLTQEGLSARAGIKFATYRRFEQTGEISLRGLLQIGFALNVLVKKDLKTLVTTPQPLIQNQDFKELTLFDNF